MLKEPFFDARVANGKIVIKESRMPPGMHTALSDKGNNATVATRGTEVDRPLRWHQRGHGVYLRPEEVRWDRGMTRGIAAGPGEERKGDTAGCSSGNFGWDRDRETKGRARDKETLACFSYGVRGSGTPRVTRGMVRGVLGKELAQDRVSDKA